MTLEFTLSYDLHPWLKWSALQIQLDFYSWTLSYILCVNLCRTFLYFVNVYILYIFAIMNLRMPCTLMSSLQFVVLVWHCQATFLLNRKKRVWYNLNPILFFTKKMWWIFKQKQTSCTTKLINIKSYRGYHHYTYILIVA